MHRFLAGIIRLSKLHTNSTDCLKHYIACGSNIPECSVSVSAISKHTIRFYHFVENLGRAYCLKRKHGAH